MLQALAFPGDPAMAVTASMAKARVEIRDNINSSSVRVYELCLYLIRITGVLQAPGGVLPTKRRHTVLFGLDCGGSPGPRPKYNLCLKANFWKHGTSTTGSRFTCWMR